MSCGDQTTIRCSRPRTSAIEDKNYTTDPQLAHTLASLTNAVLDAIQSEAKSEAIQGNAHLHLDTLLRAIHAKFNRTSPEDHEELELKVQRTLLLNCNTLDDYFAAHRTIRSDMLAASQPAIEKEGTTFKFIIREFYNHRTFNLS